LETRGPVSEWTSFLDTYCIANIIGSIVFEFRVPSMI
jgi:hypothetical protein